MQPKPAHLGRAYAEQFKDDSVAEAYPHRPAYPLAVFDTLLGLLPSGASRVLDIGCGTGDIARPLASRGLRVDAIDFSEAMVALGRQLPGGQHQHLSWIVGDVETMPLDGRYGLITAGESLHWMEWDIVLPRLRAVLEPGGFLAITGRNEVTSPWWAELLELIQHFTTNREYQPYNLIDELTARNLFEVHGRASTDQVEHRQSVESYIESMHSRNGFSRNRMSPEDAETFDAEFRRLLARHGQTEVVGINVRGSVTWGLPALGMSSI